MPIEVGKVFFSCLLLIGTGLVCSGTETPKPDEVRVQSSETKSNESRLCEVRTCSKVEYYDKLKQKCREFPGGGILVIMDHSTKCAHGDSGLHTFSRRDYYYVCHPEGVMIGLCPDSTVFSDTEKRCIGQTSNPPSTIKVHDESQNCNIIVPDCNGVGLFPIPSNCTFYFKCQEHNYDFYQYVYQCPPGKVFHPDLLRCSSSSKCYDGHEDILNNFNKDYFPECHIFGQFRTAKDCTLYYRCVPNMDGSFYQIRYECPYKMYYNIEKEICMSEMFHTCDYIPHERIIADYKKQHSLEASTQAAYPTTVICAINTKITSSLPVTVDDTTQPMDGLREVSGETMPTLEPIIDSTEKDKDGLPYVPTKAGGQDFPTDENLQSYEQSEQTTDSVGTDVPVKEWTNTDMEAMSQKSGTTEENLPYNDGGNIPGYVEDSSSDPPEDEPQAMSGEKEPAPEGIEDSDATFPPSSYQTTELPNDELANETIPGTTRRRYGFGYDEMEWDSGAWSLPNRTTVEPYESNDSNETTSLTAVSVWPDHYSEDSVTTNPYLVTLDGKIAIDYLSCTTENGTNDSYPSGDSSVPESDVNFNEISSLENVNDSTNSSEIASDSDTDIPASDLYTTNAPSAWNSVEISCTADEDGEFVCNGEKLSVKGYLEILGYTLKLTKWSDYPAEVPIESQPTVNIHLSLQHPFNYILEAYSTTYRTSFSYELSTTTVEPYTENALPEDNDDEV